MANMVNLAVPGMMLLVGILVGMILSRAFGSSMEGFQTTEELAKKCGRSGGGSDGSGGSVSPTCAACFKQFPCGCAGARPMCPPCPPCREPDLSKYVLKSTVPPCPAMPDLSKYMLKTECPPVPDLSNYVLKSSVPKPQPVILDCSKCNKPSGECPPCPRPRCPEVKCPAPTKCPPPAPCPRQTCPPTVVKCKAQDAPVQQVRPYLAPLSVTGFGM
jgi:hypothetical protein